ncbi:MAG: hypothetical protein KKD07_04595 [Candidatus Omnitrophica bacterium]|nr:hypothetical protein [Candidatus Omnitrophota bacterium]MBU1995714.1 hypothetical protein [Candidatus Omnitrophota bacterium]MBU4333701.1 hypothetical protein [Candidatus Omnitrophota bacterium]
MSINPIKKLFFCRVFLVVTISITCAFGAGFLCLMLLLMIFQIKEGQNMKSKVLSSVIV